jgi:hypothetical protein
MSPQKRSRKKKQNKPMKPATIFWIAMFGGMLIGAAAFAWFIYVKHGEAERELNSQRQRIAAAHNFPPAPTTLVADSVPQTVKAAAKNGWVPCPGKCLKLATPGWRHMHVEGHPDSDVWFRYRLQGGWSAFSQRHVGHIIKISGKQASDTGSCTICEGTGWVRKDFMGSFKR